MAHSDWPEILVLFLYVYLESASLKLFLHFKFSMKTISKIKKFKKHNFLILKFFVSGGNFDKKFLFWPKARNFMKFWFKAKNLK